LFLQRVDPGFDPSGVLAAHITLPAAVPLSDARVERRLTSAIHRKFIFADLQ
jgi:hypothetical protein